jgi:hypothetical protein
MFVVLAVVDAIREEVAVGIIRREALAAVADCPLGIIGGGGEGLKKASARRSIRAARLYDGPRG